MVSVVMTVRGDEHLAQSTCECLRDTAGDDIELVTVFDGQSPAEWADGIADQCVELSRACGTQRARHEGIVRARRAIVVLVDAHMRFSPGWARELVSLYRTREYAQTVACAVIGTLDESGTPSAECPYHGAALYERVSLSPVEHLALAAKWHAANKPGEEIGAIMGAFYVFRRAWYLEHGAPLRHGVAWGTDEEVLSVTAHLTGGRVVLLPDTVRAWHLFRRVPAYVPAPDHYALVWLQRLRYLLALPMPADYRARLLSHVCQSAYLRDNPAIVDRARLDVAKPEMREWSRCLREDLWGQFVGRWVLPGLYDERRGPQGPARIDVTTRATTTTPAVAQAAPLVRRREVCPMCDALDSFRVYGTRAGYQYVRCQRCAYATRRLLLEP